jgi:hypothetical protein
MCCDAFIPDRNSPSAEDVPSIVSNRPHSQIHIECHSFESCFFLVQNEKLSQVAFEGMSAVGKPDITGHLGFMNTHPEPFDDVVGILTVPSIRYSEIRKFTQIPQKSNGRWMGP